MSYVKITEKGNSDFNKVKVHAKDNAISLYTSATVTQFKVLIKKHKSLITFGTMVTPLFGPQLKML